MTARVLDGEGPTDRGGARHVVGRSHPRARPGQRAGPALRAGQCGAGGPRDACRRAGRRPGRADDGDRRGAPPRVRRSRSTSSSRTPATTSSGSRTRPPPTTPGRQCSAAKEAARPWRELSFDDRAAVFLKAADLLAGPWRQTLNGATLLGQSKTAFQAEIDAACELIDFWRYNVAFGRQILGGAAGLVGRRVEPYGPPPARGLRLRRHPVQLHGHRRQPSDRAGAHGQHRRVEAGVTPSSSPRTS